MSFCLLHSVFDKSAWLKDREIDELWPVAGLPAMLHVDNGRKCKTADVYLSEFFAPMRFGLILAGQPAFIFAPQ